MLKVDSQFENFFSLFIFYFLFVVAEWTGMGGRRASSEAELALSVERGSLATLLSHLPDNLYPIQPVSANSHV